MPCVLPPGDDDTPLRAVSFDAAGTLFHPVRPIGELYALVAARHGIAVDAAELHRRFRAAFHDAPPLAFPTMPATELRAREKAWWHAVVRTVFAKTTVDDFDAYFDDLFAFFASDAAWRVDPDAAPLLQKLRDHGLSILVVSNFDHRVRTVLAALGLADLIDQVTISSEAGAAKPDARIFHTALAAMTALRGTELGPAEVLHVGDTAREDLPAARAAGIQVILVGGDELAAEAPDTVCVRRLADVLPLIERRV
jgi:putative hydrolase of the HAD superfamily